jgi:hypothetical protein
VILLLPGLPYPKQTTRDELQLLLLRNPGMNTLQDFGKGGMTSRLLEMSSLSRLFDIHRKNISLEAFRSVFVRNLDLNRMAPFIFLLNIPS